MTTMEIFMAISIALSVLCLFSALVWASVMFWKDRERMVSMLFATMAVAFVFMIIGAVICE